MAIHSKPFDAQEKLEKIVFKSKPAVFSAQDLNKSTDLNNNVLTMISGMVGCMRQNWHVTICPDTTITLGETTKTLNWQVTINKDNPALDCYVFVNGVRFDMPTKMKSIVGTVTVPIGDVFEEEFILKAKKSKVTFGDDTTLCGISSDEFPTKQESCEVYQYSGEGITVSSNLIYKADEIFIASLFSIIEKYNPSTGLQELAISYRALSVADLKTMFPYSVTDTAGNPFLKNYGTYSQGSLLETFKNLKDYLDYTFAEMDNTADLALINQTLANITIWQNYTTTSINNLSSYITSIKDNVNSLSALINSLMPKGTIIAWSPGTASISDYFDAGGMGLTGTAFSCWAICNGNNATHDLRGRFLVGAIHDIPAGNPMTSNVNPNKPYEGTFPPDYVFGSTGGAPHKKLIANELPEHTHDIEYGLTGGVVVGNLVYNSQSDGMVRHTTSGVNTTTNTALSKLPPYFAVVYIMKVVDTPIPAVIP